MKFKMKLAEFRHQLVSGTLADERPQLAITLSWILNFFLGFILSTVPVMGSCGPFGIAIAAQAGGGISGLLCSTGASIGYLSLFGFQEGIKFVAAVVLVFTASYVFQELPFYRHSFFMPAVAAFFTILTGVLSAVTSVRGQPMVLPVILEGILAFGGTYFFREAFSTVERDTETRELRHSVSVLILLSCILMSLTEAMILDYVSVGRILSIVLVMICALKCGAFAGAAAGIALGTAMDISTLNAPFYTMAYGLSALVSGAFSKHGRIWFALSYILSTLLCVISNTFNGLRIELLFEVAAACVLFALLPNSILNQVGALIHPVNSMGSESGLRRYTARRIQKMSEAFKDLYSTVDRSLSKQCNDEDVSKIFDRASDIVCAKCKNKNRCWNTGYMDTLSVFNDLTPQIQAHGLITRADFPPHFMNSCLKSELLITAINGELRGQMYRRRFRARIAENRTAAYSQYFDLAEVLSDVSEELQNSFGPDLLAQRRLNRFLGSLDLDADVAVFRDRSGRLHIIIESVRLKSLLKEPAYLDKLSGAVGVRLCRPVGSDIEAEGRVTLLEAEPLSVSVGIASLKKKGESVSGDRGTYFKTEQGILCILLSDGMGSGENAARESVAAVRILERFLRSGVDPAVAMKMLNSMMLLKNDENWGFATIDLMCIDLFTGDTAFYKYGAAPSYVRSGKTIRRVRSESLAAGLTAGEDSMPDIVKMRLKPGNVALIASDGVIAETKDDWIRKLLSETKAEDTKALAKETLQMALKNYGCSDDMTVLAVKIEQRE